MLNSFSSPARLAAMVAAAGLLAACATNPVSGKRELALISESDEIAMGRAAAEEVEQTIGLVDDPGLQSYVRRIGLDMAKASQRPDLPWTFGVVDDPTPNAFALPGGFIYVTRGMATLVRSEAELAAILGHEIGHVTARHSVQAISQQQLAQLGLGIGGLLIPEIQPFGGLIGAGLGLLFLQHGRDAERQADDLGFQYAVGRGYAGTEMADVFRSLERLEDPERSALPSFLRTHPSPGERVGTLEAKVAALPAGQRGNIVRQPEYLREIDGLIYGEDPRQGFFREGEFVHPELRFRFAFPRGWTGQNMRNAVLGINPNRDAAVQLTLASGSIDAAAQQFSTRSGIRVVETASQNINGLQSRQARFEATTESGTLAGLATWISHGGRTYQFIAYSPASAIAARESTLRQMITSFGPLRDESVLNIQPQRVDVVTVPDRVTLSQLNQRLPSSIPINELAVINELNGPAALVPAGSLFKRVTGPSRTGGRP
jgi:predicted Zn-dependent protease